MKIRTAIFGVYVAAEAAGFAGLMGFVLRGVRVRYVEAMRRTRVDTASFLAVFAREAAEKNPDWIQKLAGLPPKAELMSVFACDEQGRVIFDSTEARDVGKIMAT